MRTSSSRRWRWLIFVPAALASMSVAYAGGLKVVKDVTIATDPLSGLWVGSGALGSVRWEASSGTPKKQIWCRVDSAISGNVATCEVTDAGTGDPLRCISSDPSIIQALSGMNGDSVVTVVAEKRTAPDADPPYCVGVSIENGSAYYPKWP
jgi:hypothetical protein